jgi:hypothetical protein
MINSLWRIPPVFISALFSMRGLLWRLLSLPRRVEDRAGLRRRMILLDMRPPIYATHGLPAGNGLDDFCASVIYAPGRIRFTCGEVRGWVSLCAYGFRPYICIAGTCSSMHTALGWNVLPCVAGLVCLCMIWYLALLPSVLCLAGHIRPYLTQ